MKKRVLNSELNHALNLVAFVFAMVCSFLPLADAKDLGFRYKNNSCINSEGKTGLNPGHIGQCGDLRNVVVSGLNFDDTDFSGAVFDGSDFQNSSFVNAKLIGAKLVGVNLSGADLTSAVIKGSTFKKAILINTHFAGAEIQGSVFSGADLSGQMLSTMTLAGNVFIGANFADASLDGADLSSCDLSTAKLAKVNLQGAKLDGSKVNRTDFSQGDLTGASLKGVAGIAANFSLALLRQAQLNGASLVSANMQAAKMDQASLKKSDLRSANLRQAVLKDVVYEGADFSGVAISKSTVLPMSAEEAVTLGMTFDSKANLLIIYDQNGFLGHFLSGLTKLGVSYTLHSRTQDFTGDLDLSDFSAMLHLNITDYAAAMPDQGQEAILKFVKNGGSFLTTINTNYDYAGYGQLQKLSELMLFQYASYRGDELTLEPKINSHPILNGLSAPIKYRENASPVSNLTDFSTNKSLVVLADQFDSPRVAIRDLGQGHVVGFNFCNPGAPDCLVQPVFQKLIANSVNWTAMRKLGRK